MDRPSRKSKVVNYCEPKDFHDDEDFAPPNKKAKEDVKQQDCKKSSRKSNSQETNSELTANQKRKPLDEKLHDRDLEAAITLSLLNNADGIKDQCLTSKDVKVQLPVDENTDPSSRHLSNCSVYSTILGLNEITSEKESPATSKQRKPATESMEEQRKKIKEDEDYQPKLTPDSESDDNFTEPDESEDEEFTVKKVSKTKREKVKKNEKIKQPPVSKKDKKSPKPSKPKSQAAVSTPVRSPPAAKRAQKRPAPSSTVSASRSPVPLSPAGSQIPKWNPPGQIGTSPTSCLNPVVKSPGQGLRLGLSRLVRVKPLHPSVASH